MSLGDLCTDSNKLKCRARKHFMLYVHINKISVPGNGVICCHRNFVVPQKSDNKQIKIVIAQRLYKGTFPFPFVVKFVCLVYRYITG